MYITFNYGVIFGRGDSSDWLEWEEELTPEEEEEYKRYRSAEKMPSYDEIYSRAAAAIEDQCLDDLSDDDYVAECEGRVPMDADELNDLVHSGDAHAIEYFGLEDLSEEELAEWDADIDLPYLPDVCEFQEDFEPKSPFDEGYDLRVELAEDEEELNEDDARETLKLMFADAEGDYSEVREFCDDNDENFYPENDDGPDNLFDFSELVAQELGITDYKYEEEEEQ